MSTAFIAIILFEIILIVFAIYLLWSWLTKTPFYPSQLKKLDKLFNEKEIPIDSSTNFIDIGSGDGRIMIWAAKKGALAHGIEYNPFLSLLTRVKTALKGLSKKVKVFNKDFKNHDYSNYNIVYMYLFPEHMNILKDKLFKELKPGSTIITNTFTLEEVEPYKIVDKFYFYKIVK